MIDNNHVVYFGVLMVFLIGAATVTLFGAFLLAAGLAVAFAVRLHKRRISRKPELPAQAGQGASSSRTRWRTDMEQ